VPWIHNVRNTDLIAAIDDEQTMRAFRLINEPEGHKFLEELGIGKNQIERLSYLGISSVANLIATIKLAKYFELNEDDIIFTIFTDSAAMYLSRLQEMNQERGTYSKMQANLDWEVGLKNQSIDYLKELSYMDKKQIHNLKYFTWVEQQGKSAEEMNEQWYNENYWTKRFKISSEWDHLINQFNEKTGLAKKYQ